MKKAALLLTAGVIVGCFSGCSFSDGQYKFRDSISSAEGFLCENYPDAEISNTKGLYTRQDVVGVYTDNGNEVSGFCTSEVKNGDSSFSVLVKPDSKLIYDNASTEKAKNSIKNEIVAAIGGKFPESAEIHIHNVSLKQTLSDKDCEGYLEKEADPSSLLTDDSYDITVVLKYNCDIKDIDIQQLSDTDFTAELSVMLVSSAEEKVLYGNILSNGTSYLDLIYDTAAQHRHFKESKLMWQYKHRNETTAQWDNAVYNKYDSCTSGDFTFYWNSACVTPTFTEIKAEPTILQVTKTNTFYYDALSDKATQLTFTTTDTKYKNYNEIYFTCDKKYFGESFVTLSDSKNRYYNGIRDFFSEDFLQSQCGGRIEADKAQDGEVITIGIYKQREKDKNNASDSNVGE